MCDTDAEDRIIDSITYESIISDDRVVTVGEGDQAKCFDVETISKLQVNPFTRQPWPPYVQEQVMRWLRTTMVDWEIHTLSGPVHTRVIKVYPTEKLGTVLMAISEILDPNNPEKIVNYYGNVSFEDGSRKSVSKLDLNLTLEQLDIDLSFPYFHLYHLHSNYPQDGYSAWYPYARDNGIRWLIALIPEEFHEVYEDDEPDEASFLDLYDEIMEYRIDSDNRLNDLRVLIQQSAYSYITVDQARELVVIIPDQCADILQHLIYSRVVDKWNLGGGYYESIYYRTRGRIPDYNVKINIDNAIVRCLNHQ